MKLIIYTDGGARGNPGPAGIGVFITYENGQPVRKRKRYIGNATNNQAEYEALLYGLQLAKELKAEEKAETTEVKVMMDSELVVKQLQGKYKVKNKELDKLVRRVQNMSTDFTKITYFHIPREENKIADSLVNEALDELDKPKRRRELSLKQKKRVKERDGYKCTNPKCGRSLIIDPQLELAVDHRAPFSLGGKTSPENSQTLCKDCNEYKSDRLDLDF
ncbi:MAG: reverse transcriptase-like protein [Patescibacteria group bacterium]